MSGAAVLLVVGQTVLSDASQSGSLVKSWVGGALEEEESVGLVVVVVGVVWFWKMMSLLLFLTEVTFSTVSAWNSNIEGGEGLFVLLLG